MRQRYGRGERIRLYHGRRDGSRKDLAMYRIDVDAHQAVSSRRKTDHRKMYHRLPVEFGPELGKRAWYVEPDVTDILCSRATVKWLGKDAISALALDGKDGKGGNIEKVTRWAASSGRSVAQPGMLSPTLFLPHQSLTDFSADCVL